MSDKKIKKQLNNELKPAVSPEQFCLNAGITFEANKNSAPKYKNIKRRLVEVLLPIVSIASVCLCIVLPLTLNGNDGTVNQPKYGENDVVYNRIQIDSIYVDTQAMMFNESYIFQIGTTNLITPINDSTVLAYMVSDVVYVEAVDGVPSFAYAFDFFVRCYDGYMVSSLDIYSQAEIVFFLNGIQYNYCIIGDDAYISFEYGKYDYFIHLSSFGQFTEINNGSVQLFLQKAFTEEKQDDETVSGRQVDS